MKIHALNTGNFKLDGGAMFGVVPKSIWNKTNPSDSNNMCDWAMRSLLIENDNKLILIDTGIGEKQDDKFFSHFYLSDCQNIEKKINQFGYSKTDITDVMLTHLHFDHCGGAIEWNSSRSGYQTTFQNATYWSTETHWKWAVEPNAREKASFLRENILPIEESGQLKFIDRNGFTTTENIFNNIDVIFVDGHTESMMLPIISMNGKKIVFMADLIPSIGHIPLPYIMGYDTRPLLTLTEKEKFLLEAFENEYILFFEHDYVNECCTLKSTDRGIRVDQTFPLNELFK
jgi:glyoxylase-like metal-dependent hydrolase (beta-lactamase superfamily II)